MSFVFVLRKACLAFIFWKVLFISPVISFCRWKGVSKPFFHGGPEDQYRSLFYEFLVVLGCDIPLGVIRVL